MPEIHYQFVGGGDVILSKWARNVEDASEAFGAMADHQRTIWEKQFSTEGRYTGPGRWEPLNFDYARWKSRHFPGKPILQRTGVLYDSLTKRPFGVEEIDPHFIIMGTDVPYAQYHQEGTDHMPARPILGAPPKSDIAVFAKILQSWIARGTARP